MKNDQLKRIIEAALMVSDAPLSVSQLAKIIGDKSIKNSQIKDIIKSISEEFNDRGVVLKEVASGYRFQVDPTLSPWIQKLWDERPTRYSRALLETLALIAYRQPITRAEIEDIRGVAVSTNIIKTLLEREWVNIIGYKDTPGKPALLATTKIFLDDFSIQSLTELPELSEINEFDNFAAQLDVQLSAPVQQDAEPIALAEE